MIYSLLISLLVGLFMVSGLHFYSYDIIKAIYLRGAFNLYDVHQTSVYLYELSFSFLLLFMTTILFQPFLSLPISETKEMRLKLVIIFMTALLLSCCIVFFPDFSAIEKSLVVMYFSSFTSFALAAYSYIKYLRYEN